MGIGLEQVKAYPADEFNNRLPPDTAPSPALSLVANYLAGAAPCWEFLPPKINSWQQLTTRFSSKKLMWAGATAGSVVLLVAAAFLLQEWQLSRLRSKWATLEPRARELEVMQQQIKKFRPWFDDSFRSLSVLRKVTEAFPEDGVVSGYLLSVHAPLLCAQRGRETL